MGQHGRVAIVGGQTARRKGVIIVVLVVNKVGKTALAVVVIVSGPMAMGITTIRGVGSITLVALVIGAWATDGAAIREIVVRVVRVAGVIVVQPFAVAVSPPVSVGVHPVGGAMCCAAECFFICNTAAGGAVCAWLLLVIVKRQRVRCRGGAQWRVVGSCRKLVGRSARTTIASLAGAVRAEAAESVTARQPGVGRVTTKAIVLVVAVVFIPLVLSLVVVVTVTNR
jgi:hypothetical protein